jgi:transposase
MRNGSTQLRRYRSPASHLTTRETNKLKPTQAQTVLADAILRQLHAVITTGRAWDPDIATHGTRGTPTTPTEVAA